ncbi:MAG TPA: hypothetical protein PLJ60_05870 [Chryseolinea sp.]|nr:hypothetical protein [Chryseolinea sp.]HPM29846.1 hypothetical protein [Chryseolinea sp.]
MQSFFFWKNWHKEYRTIWYVVVSVFFLSLIFLWFSYFEGASGVIHWEKLQEQKIIETTIHEFNLGPFQLSVPGESFVILEYFNGSELTPNTNASYIFLTVFVISTVVLITLITVLEGLWYYVAMGLFILFVVSLRFEVLGIFGMTNKIPVVGILILYVGSSFYFNRFRSETPFVTRFITFASITFIVGLAIYFFSSVGYPLYHLTLTGYTSALVLSVIFIITIAHEVFGSFIYVVSQGSTKSLRHLSIISVIYFVNLVITCLHELGVFQFNFIYINLYLLLSISAVLGIWGFRNREAIYGNILPFNPFGGYFFLAIGAICFVTTAQLIGNANDAALKIIRDAIIFSHTAYGLIFMTYIFSNFVLMLARNLNVYKVLYNPTRMPYFSYRFAGLIAMLAFVFYSNWQSYVYNGLAGFYNTTGDLYMLLGNDEYAESFYNQGKSQGFQNNRSNYALAHLKANRFNFEDAHEHYDDANAKRPTEYSLTNAGNLYIWEDKVFDAIKSFQAANKKLPDSGPLENNLAFSFIKVHNLDSSVYYLSKAREHSLSKTSAEINFMAMSALELLPVKTDSILGLFNNQSPALLSNALALSTVNHRDLTSNIDPLKEKKLNLFTATLLNNYVIKHVKSLDTTFTNAAYTLASDSLNSDFNEAIKYSLSFAYYHQGNVAKALSILAELAYISQSYQGKYAYTMGLWALEQGNPELATTYFTNADTYNYKQAKFYQAIALSEAGKTNEAFMAWDTVAQSKDEGEKYIADKMKYLLTIPTSNALELNDPDKYQFLRYRISIRDSLLFNRIVNTFTNVNYKAQAILDFSKKCFEADQLPTAIHYFNRLAGLQLTNKKLYTDVRFTELRMLAYRKDVRTLATQINNEIEFDNSNTLEKMLYAALLAETNGDFVLARKNYSILGKYNPYFVEGIIAAANFERSQNEKSLNAYNILAEAIQVNNNSVRLLKAYITEAARQGFDEYAQSALMQLKVVQGAE